MKFRIFRKFNHAEYEDFEGDFPALADRIAQLIENGCAIDNIKIFTNEPVAIEGGRAFTIMKEAMQKLQAKQKGAFPPPQPWRQLWMMACQKC